MGRRIRSLFGINEMSTKDDGLSEQNFLPKYEMEKGQMGPGERNTAIYHSPLETLAD